MNTAIVNDQQLQLEVDKLKIEFDETKDIYREVCVLLFFRYGITPTANKLYQYVRRGSMSAPADALKKFWLELREKSRVRIERPDIPENIAAVAGDLISHLWNEAQKAAQAGFSTLVENATAEILQFKIQTEAAETKSSNLQKDLDEKNNNLKNCLNQLAEAEKRHIVDTQTLATENKRLVALQNDNELLKIELANNNKYFKEQIDVLNHKLVSTEDRHRAHESKYLLEIDRLRQSKKFIEDSIVSIKKDSKLEKATFQKEVAMQYRTILNLQNRLGLSEGHLQTALKRNNELKRDLRQLERKFNAANRKLKT